MKTLSEAEVRQQLDPARLIAALEAAFRERFPEMAVPARTQMQLAAGIFMVMPCYDRAGHALGMKLVVVQERPTRPEDRVQATYLLLDPATAIPRLILAANYLTDLRTAATSAVATKFLARTDVRTLGIFGTGRLARAHARVLPLVRRFERILVSSHTPTRAERFAQDLQAELRLPMEAVDPNDCAAGSDVICTCTISATPLFDGSVLRPGTHLNLVGAFQAHTREVDSATIRRARVIVETYEGALAEAGDVLIPMGEGVIGREHLAADLHSLLRGARQGRTGSEDITVFKSLGCSLEDLVAAELLGS